MGLKLRSGEERGMRIHPEIHIVEEAEGFVWIRRQHRMVKGRRESDLLIVVMKHVECGHRMWSAGICANVGSVAGRSGNGDMEHI